MANFAGLLKKTIDAQKNPTPQLRARVYARARETVERKLAETKVPKSAMQAQLQALDDAIKSVEEDYLAVERELLSTIIKKPVMARPLPAAEGPKQQQVRKADVRGGSSASYSQPGEKASMRQQPPVPGAGYTGKAPAGESRSHQAGDINKSNERFRPEVPVSQPPLSGYQKTPHPADYKPASSAARAGKQNGFFSMSRKKPEAEPVNMENIILAENDARQAQSEKEAQSAKVLGNSQQNGDYDIVSDIFAQAARRTERQAAKKRAIVIGLSVAAVVIVVVGVLFTAWSFLSGKEKLEKAETIAETNANEQPREKFTQRLLADGTEVDEGPAKSELKTEEGTSTAAASTDATTREQLGEAVFYQARTDTQDEKVETGTVQWSLVKEKATAQHGEEIAVRGNVTIPDEKLSLRLTLRRNTDPSLPAAYLLEAIFIVPDNFEGKAIDNVHELTFKDSEQSTGQQLTGTVEARIGDDFFLFALTADNPFRDRNLQLMKQLGWMRLVVTDKNQRILELTFSKGPTGEAIFNEVINKWIEQDNKPTVYDQKQETTGKN